MSEPFGGIRGYNPVISSLLDTVSSGIQATSAQDGGLEAIRDSIDTWKQGESLESQVTTFKGGALSDQAFVEEPEDYYSRMANTPVQDAGGIVSASDMLGALNDPNADTAEDLTGLFKSVRFSLTQQTLDRGSDKVSEMNTKTQLALAEANDAEARASALLKDYQDLLQEMRK
jgi:hypothetical protein